MDTTLLARVTARVSTFSDAVLFVLAIPAKQLAERERERGRDMTREREIIHSTKLFTD